MKYLIVGLGNIGVQYDATRHNIGFDVADVLCIKHKGTYTNDRLAYRAQVRIRGKQVVIIKPTTYMNLSGKAVKYWMEKEKVSIDNVIVIVDDLALPLGALRLRKSGGAAGHNGLLDIEATLNTKQYPRLRFGIGNDYPKGRQADFVLGKWLSTEIPIVQDAMLKAVEAIESVLHMGFDRSMNIYNTK